MKTKRLFLTNVIALFICLVMLLGSTYAWFTDYASSKDNVIHSGTLDVEMYWSDTLIPEDSADWKNAENASIFTYDRWEPGYTEVKYIKVVNKGNLSFKWKIDLEAEGNVTKLAEVIDVYSVNPVESALTKTSLNAGNLAGTLSETIGTSVAEGVILPLDEASVEYPSVDTILAIAFHMQEEAGNEYAGLSLGDGFALSVKATQFNYEEGAFGDGYDANAQWPSSGNAISNSASAPVNTTAGNKVADKVTLISDDKKIFADVPAGVQLDAGVDKVTLTVSDVPKSEANVTVGETEEARSIDVHINGVAESNDVVMPITIKELLPVGLNMGNYRFYHVENGATVEMTLLADGATPVHNNYEYDPATGDVVLHLKSFSEVALVADTENAWRGTFDYEWYTNAATFVDGDSVPLYTIANADQLAAFGAIVGGMAEGIEQDSFSGKVVKLIADINIGDLDSENSIVFYPIGYNSSDGKYEKTGVAVTTGFYNFCGTFDGNGNTIANFYHNTWEMKGDNNYYDATLQYYRDGMGLFGKVYGGTVKNLTVKNFSSDGEYTTTGVIAAYADGATFENIAITNCNPRVYNIGNGGIVGCVGWYAKEANLKTTFKNITVDNSNKISALWGSYDVACGGIVGQYYPTSGQTSAGTPANGGVHFDNCHISAQMDVYNDVCANYQYYAYRYTGMLIGSVRENVTIDGHSYPKMDGITAENCTVHFGTWNDYYYCEIIDNTTASYTHDYQMSRLTQVSGVDIENKKYLPLGEEDVAEKWVDIPTSGRVNYVVVNGEHATENATCYHFKDGAVWNHEDGGKETIDGVEVLKEDKQHIYLEFNNLVTGYGWGVTTKVVGELEGVRILDREVADSVEKFETKFTGDFLYRVGNQNTVSIGSLFAAKDGVTISNSGVWVKVEKVDENCNVSGMFTADTTDWTKGTIQFSGTGVVKVTIQDYNFCIPTVLYLEVVDATNVTGLSGALSGNVVLLNDCGLSSLTVSGRNTVFGNGFTATYSGTGQYLRNGLKQGVINITENGKLDNLRVVAPIYPKAYMYYGATTLGDYVQGGPYFEGPNGYAYYYQLSAVAASGNATITNCYIYGGRNNIYIETGDVTVKGTILECGTVANIQIQSNVNHTVTFEDITTIQYKVNPTIGETDSDKAKVMLGAGILVGPETNNNPAIVLNGYLKQYNWVNADDEKAVSDDVTKQIIGAAVGATNFNHTVDGKTSSNLGIIYMNAYDAKITNNTGMPYAKETISISGVDGQAYSLKGASAEQIYSDYKNANKSTVNDFYIPQFKYPADLGGQYIENTTDCDEFVYREGDTIKVMFISGDTKTLDLAALVGINKYYGQNLSIVITCKDSQGNEITLNGGKITLSKADEYTITYSVTDTMFYDKDGNTVTNTKKYSWDVTLSVSLKDKSVPNAEFDFDSSKQIMGYAKKSGFSGLGKNNFQYIPFLAGLKIYDYVGQNQYLRFDGNTDFNKIAKVELKCENDNAYITVTLTDGGVIYVEFFGRADSGSSTKTGTIKTNNNTVYYLTDGDTSATTTTWTIKKYSFVGNNGVEISNTSQVFRNCVSGTIPSGSFNTSIKYTVTYDANGGDCGQTLGYATSTAPAVVLPTPTRFGYTFLGWYTSATGGERVGGADGSYTPSANITLYAQWGAPCTVTYNANGGDCGTESEKFDGKTLILPEASRDGYTFLGWYTASTGGKRIGAAGDSYNPTGDITLYAQWQKPITVTYNANGGSCGTSSELYDGDLKLPTPNKEGHAFLGWYTAASGGTKVGDADASYTPTANITLYAQWQINSYTIKVTTKNATVKVNETTVSNKGTASIQYGAKVTVKVTYSKSDSRSTTITGDDGTTYTSPFTMPAQNVTINATSKDSCVTSDTLITLADGTQKRIDQVTYADKILVWNFYTGKYDFAPASILMNHGASTVNVTTLNFADGTSINTINGHGFFDVATNEFVLIDEFNAADYIGHSFVKQNGDGYSTTKLVSYSVEKQYTEVWSILTAEHYNCILEGMWTVTAAEVENSPEWLMPYEIGEDMKYDEASMQADIAEYGLYTYEDFAEYMTYEQFKALGLENFKVSVGKGYITWEEILFLISIHIG